MTAPLALLGFPSVEDIVRKVVGLLFGALSQALLPDFLRDGTVDAIRWLIAVPNPADAALWPNVARLEGDMAALGFGLLGLSLVMATARYTLAGMTGGPHPLTALGQTVGAAAAITLYHFAFANSVALVNVVSHQILEWPVVAQGLGRTVKVLFGGSLLVGAGSAFLAALALIAILFATTLFIMKVAVLMLAAMLYVAGPAVIGIYPLGPETARLARMWVSAATAVALIPLGWCVIFATAGALSLDVTSFGALGGQGTATVVGAKTTGVFAGLLMFAFAAMWPFKVAGLVTQVRVATRGPAGAGVSAATPATALRSARVQAAQARLRAGVMAGGGVVGRAAGAAGAPRGGLAGIATRAGAGVASRTRGSRSPAAARAAAAAATAPVAAAAARVTQTKPGNAALQRGKRAVDVLREGPAAVKEAAAQAGRRHRARTQNAPRPEPRDAPPNVARGEVAAHERATPPRAEAAARKPATPRPRGERRERLAPAPRGPQGEPPATDPSPEKPTRRLATAAETPPPRSRKRRSTTPTEDDA